VRYSFERAAKPFSRAELQRQGASLADVDSVAVVEGPRPEIDVRSTRLELAGVEAVSCWRAQSHCQAAAATIV
jgi:hypothetical protein